LQFDQIVCAERAEAVDCGLRVYGGGVASRGVEDSGHGVVGECPCDAGLEDLRLGDGFVERHWLRASVGHDLQAYGQSS